MLVLAINLDSPCAICTLGQTHLVPANKENGRWENVCDHSTMSRSGVSVKEEVYLTVGVGVGVGSGVGAGVGLV